MTLLKIHNKTGFISMSPVFITSIEGTPFLYVNENKNFTLPQGRFICYGKIIASDFSHLDGKTLHRPDKRTTLNKHNVIFTNNPNKVSIDVRKGKIIVDNKFWQSLNEIQKNFVLAHELGHYRYYDEQKADRFAAHLLLMKGYNPTQIVAAANTTLSDYSQERKTALYNYLKLRK